MLPTLCRICLRSDFESSKDVDDRLSMFHDELCDFDVIPNKRLKFCSICEHLLRKFYNFKMKCQRAHKILKSNRNKMKGFDLQNLMPPSSIGFSTATDRQQIFNLIPSEISELQPYLIFQNMTHHNMVHDKTIADEDAIVIKLEDKIDSIDPISVAQEIDSIDLMSLVQGIKQEPMSTLSIEENALPTPCKQIEESPATCLQENELLTSCIQRNEIEIIKNGDLVTSLNEDDDFSEAEYLSNDDDEQVFDVDDEIQISDENDEKQNICNNDDDTKIKNKDNKMKMLKTKRKKNLMKTDLISIDDLETMNNSTIAKRRKVLKMCQKKLVFKERACCLLEQDNFQVENIKVTKEEFLKMFDKCADSKLRLHGVFGEGPIDPGRLKKFLEYLMKRHNPEYESVFHVQLLNTHELKLAEFEARKNSEEFLKAPFKCQICFKGFQLQTLLDYHNKWHDDSRPHGCEICNMRFLCPNNVRAHNQKSHEAVFRCKLCNVVIYQYEAMLNHYQAHKGKLYVCNICLGEYRSNSSLKTHLLTHGTHACPHCARRFVSDYGLLRHVNMKHTEAAATKSTQSVSCKQCGITFESRDAFRVHKRQRHSAEKCLKYTCRYTNCMEKFNSPELLREHTLKEGHARTACRPRHPGLWSRSRGQTVKSGNSEPRREALAPINATDPDNPYRTCPVCQKQVPLTAHKSLYAHHLVAHPDLPYLEAAVEQDGFLCEQCGKTFRVRSFYKDHLNTHLGVKPYECSECGARFSMKRALSMHRMRHRPPRYKCKDCGKMFLTASNLYVHRRTHIGDRRFKCEVCHKGYLHHSTLKEHIKSVHNQIRRVKKPAKTSRKRAKE